MPSTLRWAYGVSFAAHLLIACSVWAFGWMDEGFRQPPQRVLTAKIVRLGPERDKTLLPRLPESQASKAATKLPPVPKTPSIPKAVPSKPAVDSGRAARQALHRLREQLSGQPDASIQGDADESELGDAYVAQIRDCLLEHYVIEGSNKAQLQGQSALVLLRIQADGRIINHRVLKSAHNPAFDQAVSRAVSGCGRVSPPPAGLRKRLLQEGIEIEFQP